MAESPSPEIPRRSSFKPAEVCEIAEVKPYVLRSWEAEFPNLGVTKGHGSRVYRRQDVQLVLRLKRMLFVDGLTLGGARRRLESELEEADLPEAEEPLMGAIADPAVRQRLEEVKRGLRGILEMLSGNGAGEAARRQPAPADGRPARGRGKGATRHR